MNNKPTIAAFIILVFSLLLAFLITASEQDSRATRKDVEVFIVKQPVDVPQNLIDKEPVFVFKKIRNNIIDELKGKRRFLFLLVDSFEIEISDFWREVLNTFEIFEYYKAFPEAFIRRLVFMPTFTGNKDYLERDDIYEKPMTYPDYDYRSIRYRVSLVPDTIERTKAVIDFVYSRLAISLSF